MFGFVSALYQGIVHASPLVFLALTGSAAAATRLVPEQGSHRSGTALAVRCTIAAVGWVTLLAILVTLIVWLANAAAHGQL